jgi:hypothetical protein
VLNQGSKVDDISRDPSFRQKLGDNDGKNALVHSRAEDSRSHFPDSQT